MQFGFFKLFGCRTLRHTSASRPNIASDEHEMGDPRLRARGLCDCSRTASGNSKKVEALHAGGVDNRFEVVVVSLERKFDPIAVGQAAATQIVADQRVVRSK